MKLRKLCKYMIVFSMVSSMAFGMVGCEDSVANASDSEATALNKDVLVVGLDDNFPPMGYRDENGDIVGFDVDFAKAFGEKIGKEIEFQTIDWTMKEAELDAGNIDFIWNGYSINDERKVQVDFSVPYLKNQQIIITLADSAINTKADLAGKVVGAQAGSTAVEAVEDQPEVMETFKDGKVVTYENNNDALMDLEAGRLEAVVADEVLVNYYISKKGEGKFKILTENFGEEEYGVGMKKGDTELVEALNNTYKELKEDGTMAEISEKWFGEDITQ
ncbi:amino acid ABC transporter substrate-binding protein [Cellulosilyticum ruminicola]|uniref:amino acid ABC transporter substrate-binding protein n=1 Tax=Cellulosilyticum ruminicola TaxID=425254 RepID=UPI0006D053BA|nr:amino acid ABC transporter substrate-binding protein [Cellulosilyticum ruminicola]